MDGQAVVARHGPAPRVGVPDGDEVVGVRGRVRELERERPAVVRQHHARDRRAVRVGQRDDGVEARGLRPDEDGQDAGRVAGLVRRPQPVNVHVRGRAETGVEGVVDPRPGLLKELGERGGRRQRVVLPALGVDRVVAAAAGPGRVRHEGELVPADGEGGRPGGHAGVVRRPVGGRRQVQGHVPRSGPVADAGGEDGAGRVEDFQPGDEQAEPGHRDRGRQPQAAQVVRPELERVHVGRGGNVGRRADDVGRRPRPAGGLNLRGGRQRLVPGGPLEGVRLARAVQGDDAGRVRRGETGAGLERLVGHDGRRVVAARQAEDVPGLVQGRRENVVERAGPDAERQATVEDDVPGPGARRQVERQGQGDDAVERGGGDADVPEAGVVDRRAGGAEGLPAVGHQPDVDVGGRRPRLDGAEDFGAAGGPEGRRQPARAAVHVRPVRGERQGHVRGRPGDAEHRRGVAPFELLGPRSEGESLSGHGRLQELFRGRFLRHPDGAGGPDDRPEFGH